MSKKVVSLIVPVYNSEIYLQKCLECILKQSYSSLEIILVNDGSTDSSKAIIDEFSAKDKRVIAIHKENGGIGSAYKVAFKVMTGDYILFVDSDDWLELNAVDELVKLAIENSADIVSFSIRALNQEGVDVELWSFKNIDYLSYSNEEILKIHFEVLRHPTLARLYKRILFDDITIFEQNIGIDEMLTPQLLEKCNRAVYASNVFYYALIRQESVCRARYDEKKIRDTIRVYQFLCGFMEKKIPQYADLIREKYLDVVADMYKFSLENHNSIEKETKAFARSELLTTYRKTRRLTLYKGKPLRFRIMVILVVFFPFTFEIYKWLGKRNNDAA